MVAKIAIRDLFTREWVRGSRTRGVIRADRLEDVTAGLQELEARLERDRLYAVGFISYEASPAFDPALRTKPISRFPYLYFVLLDRLCPFQFPGEVSTTYKLSPWQADVSPSEFCKAIARIKRDIRQGKTYQVNYTFRQRSQFEGDAWPLFLDLVAAQNTPYCSYIETDEFAICSASPELFFRKIGNRIELRPMKGTVARGRTLDEDAANQAWLQRSRKDRAENLMIVDMIRNDVGQIAELGSVEVPTLFEIERYPSIHQMTSTVQATVRTSLSETIAALFPCASITGAPKASTMAAITELETSPRKLYTGGIGLICPDGSMQFSVAIRTVLIDKTTGEAEYGVGSGIVWDSRSNREYDECMEKSKILTYRLPNFDLLESVLWEPSSGYFLLDNHLERLCQSGEYFEFRLDRQQIEQQLQKQASVLSEPSKVRLTVAKGGSISISTQPLSDRTIQAPVVLALSAKPIRTAPALLLHKTTYRDTYNRLMAQCPQAHDVILWNEQGQITEGCWGNIAVATGGVWFTPPVKCGLLAGVYRQHLLEAGFLQERIITVADLKQADRIAWFNSVRKWKEATLM